MPCRYPIDKERHYPSMQRVGGGVDEYKSPFTTVINSYSLVCFESAPSREAFGEEPIVSTVA
jgi:hypothetical protein